MVNVSAVLSVMFIFRVPMKEWGECVPFSLKDFFEKYGDILPKRVGEKIEHSVPQQKPEVFLQPTNGCGLLLAFTALCNHGFQVFSASHVHEEQKDCMQLRFMTCPDVDIEWMNTRPFEPMQRACGGACAMAAWRAMGYNNQYIKGGELFEGMRALSINGDRPNWLLNPNSQPIVDVATGAPKKPRHQLILDSGEFKLR